ncbi:hypothetical protein AKJ40_04430 [candidate division MSBL1 archaeon SCGC-AAA259M10]|uniref:Uncharacterized protein n=1 Tax=candidate division MSBL1 archaeon SCGC-AAA259M10 TaxID=1698270 RepID=A0A133UXA0_9EURY|nr:hypothetical protein AKJ40_04430 [candidate division MSBL1 archaeon SCGC-AAA259M10]
MELNQWGNPGIKTEEAFFYLKDKIDFDNPISKILEKIEQEIKEISRELLGEEPTGNSLRRSRGDWFELIVFEAVWEAIPPNNNFVAIKLPRARVGSGGYLGNFRESEVKDNLIKKNLYCSNPDFMVFKESEENGSGWKDMSLRKIWGDKSKEISGTIKMENVFSIIAAKTNPRPDRRYQHLHEATTTKTIHKLADKPKGGIKYHTVMMKMGEKDKEVYTYPFIYNMIVNGSVKPVIDSYLVSESYTDILEFFRKIFNKSEGSRH